MEPLKWIPGGARGGDKAALSSCEQYLMCVRLAGRLSGGQPWLDWHVVEVQKGPAGDVVFHSNGWRWQWDDVSWCLPMSDLELPEGVQ